jgi:hypothetical protein
MNRLNLLHNYCILFIEIRVIKVYQLDPKIVLPILSAVGGRVWVGVWVGVCWPFPWAVFTLADALFSPIFFFTKNNIFRGESVCNDLKKK